MSTNAPRRPSTDVPKPPPPPPPPPKRVGVKLIGVDMSSENLDLTKLSSDVLGDSYKLTVVEATKKAEVELILAKGRAEALLVLMEAQEKYYSALAGSQENLNAAEATMSPEMISMRLKISMLDKLPELMKASGKTIEQLLPDLMKLLDL